MKTLEQLDACYLAMPPVAAMGIRSAGWDGRVLRLRAPLAANVNDKGTVFGGSMASIATLAAWGLLTLRLGEEGIKAEVYVADSQLKYLKPLVADLAAEAWLDEGTDWDAFLRSYRERGRARAQLVARVLGPDGATVAEFTGRFAALRAP
jgi:thioesterase domain-containing protein